jgi:integrase
MRLVRLRAPTGAIEVRTAATTHDARPASGDASLVRAGAAPRSARPDRAAGLRRIRFHDLRHSAASTLIAKGVHPKAIQELLRHSSIQLTMDTYGHLFDEMQRETADKMDAVLAVEKSEKDPSAVVKTVVKPRLVRVK